MKGMLECTENKMVVGRTFQGRREFTMMEIIHEFVLMNDIWGHGYIHSINNKVRHKDRCR